MVMENGGGEDCCVKVAVHIRPLIGDERLQGCKDCVTVVPGKPQIQIGTHSFTFDHVYGNSGSPSSSMFDECVAPLVDGLFQGYNATVLAYGQTGSGKTYTMGTGGKDCQTGLIQQVMSVLFNKIENLKQQADFQLRVSFIEILKEEVRDLLDSATLGKLESVNGHPGKVTVPGKPPLQIREASNGVITLSGSTEIDVCTQTEMAACLEQGSLNRATGSTNMNNQSSRSHAIFTITVEQMRHDDSNFTIDGCSNEAEDYLCAKLHLVDLAGSERAKRTGSDGQRFKEGVHINKGLLALGNVISALGDEKKRKEGVHVPYRDSKLTRLLQDSLGGNSRTVMIACISPADVNVEETLNTLKYANRARNIQNKPIVNRNPVSDEMRKMRKQLEYLQAELLYARGGGTSFDQIQVLKERISSLEATNAILTRELQEYHNRYSHMEHYETESQNAEAYFVKSERLKRSLQSTETCDIRMTETLRDDDCKEFDDEAAKEWEHNIIQDSMGKELNELNKRLEQKEHEMKMFGAVEPVTLSQHFRKKLLELEEEKRMVQQERDRLLAEVESLAANSDGQTHKLPEIHVQKLKALEAQILDLKKKQENQVQLLKQKQKSEEAAKKLQEDIQCIKAQKVQLQHKIKQEAEQFRQWKASREKELLQLRKEGRRNEHERHKLQALNQRQKMVLQRKTEEAAMATKKLKELLEARKSSARESTASANGHSPSFQMNEKSLQRWIDHELEVVVNVHEVRCEYDKQSQLRASLVEELDILKQEDTGNGGLGPLRGKMKYPRVSAMSPDATMARIASLETMVTISSNTLATMAAQLAEADERERAMTSRGRWNQLKQMGEAKSLLQHMFNIAAESRCQLKDKETEINELKEQLKELVVIIRQSEARRKEVEKQLKTREPPLASHTPASGTSNGALKHAADESSTPLSPIPTPAQKQLKFTAGIANGSNREAKNYNEQMTKVIPLGQLSRGKRLALAGQSGKLWKWKRSHHQWILQFKWKWQKPWRLSELIRQTDETIVKARPRTRVLQSSRIM